MRYQKAKVKEPNLTLKISKRKSEVVKLDPKDCQERFFCRFEASPVGSKAVVEVGHSCGELKRGIGGEIWLRVLGEI